MTARNNKTRLPLLHHHTPVVSVAAERLCVPQLEEAGFLKREKKKSTCYKSVCDRIIYTYSAEHSSDRTRSQSYHRVPLSASASSPQLFGACPPVPSCTGTPVSVSPLDEAGTTLQQCYSNIRPA